MWWCFIDFFGGKKIGSFVFYKMLLLNYYLVNLIVSFLLWNYLIYFMTRSIIFVNIMLSIWFSEV